MKWKLAEMRIRRLLRKFAKQRVTAVMGPTSIWLIERAVTSEKYFDGDIQTCLMRGWLEVLQEGVPSNELSKDGELPDGPMFSDVQNVYRLTSEGWAVVNRSQWYVVLSLLISMASLFVALAALIITLKPSF